MNQSKLTKGERTKHRLLQSAAKEFADKGYHEAKVSVIVADAQLTQPAFYLYFKNKKAAFDECIEHFTQRLHASVKRSYLFADLPAQFVPGKIQEGLTSLFTFFVEEPHLTKVALYQSEQGEKIKQELIKMMTGVFYKYQQDKLIRASLYVETAAEGWIGMIDRLIYSRLLTGDKQPSELAKEMLDTYFYGIFSDVSREESLKRR